MKAEIVYDSKNNPRVRLHGLSSEELKVLRYADRLDCLLTGTTNGAFDMMFTIEMMDEEAIEKEKRRERQMAEADMYGI